ncbi:Acetyltransferase YpeA [Nocardioides aquaticus]|uniref:Acetyltransferase YpeA n=1 Tax=Nocardioides aquaticus TaxID=160826 RepID=A0ABX8ECM0_9ACTN|nr:GNAT family N-acetyltransferase [Nocardioides aquaticus]QVT78207.1 Acetyltransferase YpeA [Nocardioides aquaticus]
MTVIPEDSRFETDPEQLLPELPGLPGGWTVDVPDPGDREDVARLTVLLRAHEKEGRGWAGAAEEDVLVEVSERGLRTRSNVVVRDADRVPRAWGSVHDRAGGRMLLLHVVERGLPDSVARACSDVLVEWAVGQAREVGAARGLEVQQIDTGAFEGDERQARWLREAGFEKVRTWWQMNRPVQPEESTLVPDPAGWERAEKGVRFRLVRRAGSGMPNEDDLRDVHDVLEEAFLDHFNSWEETFEEFLYRLREDPGHRWDHWWLAETVDGSEPRAVGALVGTVSESSNGPDGSYVSYIGVREAARGRGVAKGLLHTIIADAAARDRDRVGLEVDADSSTGADGLYGSLGWRTKYVTESWHRDVPVD